MASFRKRGSGQWQAQVRKKGYPTHTKSFRTRAAATQWVRSIEYETDQGLFVSRNEAETTTVGDLLDRYLIEYTADKTRCGFGGLPNTQVAAPSIAVVCISFR